VEFTTDPSEYKDDDTDISMGSAEESAEESELTPLSDDSQDETNDGPKHFPASFKKHSHTISLVADQLQELGLEEFPESEVNRPGIVPNKDISGYERAGVVHLVHAWYAQKHDKPQVFFPFCLI
jgi:hypothetical protein